MHLNHKAVLYEQNARRYYCPENTVSVIYWSVKLTVAQLIEDQWLFTLSSGYDKKVKLENLILEPTNLCF